VAESSARFELCIPTVSDGLIILEIARRIPLFDAADVETIQELWMDFTSKGDDSWYHFLAARKEGILVGFACYGKRPLTEGTYDLYWIAVDTNYHRLGIGEFLLKEVESKVQACEGHLLIAETAGKPAFEPTRQFYIGSGYELEAKLRDFYAVGDDLCIFTKHFPNK
jgi:GNAT superfamily N-acetyltransferase